MNRTIEFDGGEISALDRILRTHGAQLQAKLGSEKDPVRKAEIRSSIDRVDELFRKIRPDLQHPATKPSSYREKALRFGALAAGKQFADRKGHGGNPQLAERHLTRQQIEVLLAAAWEAGAEFGSSS